jgi:hypothetical protein
MGKHKKSYIIDEQFRLAIRRISHCPSSQLIRLLKSARIRQPSGVEVNLIIEKIADSNWQLARKAGSWYLVLGTWGEPGCDPLLTGIGFGIG